MRYRWVRTLGDDGWKTTMTRAVGGAGHDPDIEGPAGRLAKGACLADRDRGCPHRRRGSSTPTGGCSSCCPPRRRPTRRRSTSGAAASGGARSRSRRRGGIQGEPGDRRSRREPTPATRRPIRARANGSSICCPPPRDAGRGAPRSRGTWDRRRALVRGLERFVQNRDGDTTEVLSDPTWSVPRRDQRRRATARSSRTASCLRRGPGRGSRPPAHPQRAAPVARERRSRARRLRALQHPPRSRRRAMTRRLGIVAIALAAAVAAARPAMAQDPPLVLVHGFKSNGTTWVDAETRFNRQLTVTVYNPTVDWQAAVPRAGGAAAGQASGHRRACLSSSATATAASSPGSGARPSR